MSRSSERSIAFELDALIRAELEAKSLRRAGYGEAGWFLEIKSPPAIGCNIATLRIWVTDAPCVPVRNDAP